MRVTNATYYKDYSAMVQELHSKLNKSMNQVSSERKYDSAEENPLAYYSGKKMDNQYQNISTQETMITDVVNRMHQQEQGVVSIQSEMRYVNTNMMRLVNGSTSGEATTVATFNTDFQQRVQSMVNDLNTQYENYYVFGGNDSTTVPFSLVSDLSPDPKDNKNNSYTFTFRHKFPGDVTATEMSIKYSLADDGKELRTEYSMKAPKDAATGATPTMETSNDKTKVLGKMLQAMQEEGRMNLGYGSLAHRDTLPETTANGLNVLTGLTADGLQSLEKKDSAATLDLLDQEFKRNPVALTVQTILVTQNYEDALTTKDDAKIVEIREKMSGAVGEVLDEWDDSEQRLSSSYRESGILQNALNETKKRLQSQEDTLISNYTDKLGIDMYDAIQQMYSFQKSYNAALRVSSQVMQSSMFDYVK